MIFGNFMKNRSALEEQYRNVQWIEDSGLAPDQLRKQCDEIVAQWDAEGLDRSLIKAKLFAFVLDNAQLAVTPEELYQDHIRHEFIVQGLRSRWVNEQHETVLAEPYQLKNKYHQCGIFKVLEDFGHTVPDWYDIVNYGIPGLLDRILQAKQAHLEKGTLTPQREIFYEAGRIVYTSVLRYMRRLGDQCRKCAENYTSDDRERLLYCAEDLEALAAGAPHTLHQALQLVYIFHILQEEIEGERLRSLGGLDRIFTRFMRQDLDAGRFTRDDLIELWQYLFQKFHALTGDTFFGEPMYLAGLLPDGTCAVNEFTYLILEAYDQLNVANPKFHIRVSKKTPPEFVKTVLDYVRHGNSSFVFVSDECAIPMMMKYVGATFEEACEWTPIGCYEPGILGREIACTGIGGFSIPKLLELVLYNGEDPLTKQIMGIPTGTCEDFDTFDKLLDALKRQISYIVGLATDTVCLLEKQYMRMNPSPLFSGTLIECVEQGLDAFASGAKYNNSALSAYGIATVADSLSIIKKYVYEQKELTLAQFRDILSSNWEGHEKLRLQIRKDPDKFGNNRPIPDALAYDISKHIADTINATSNARGGRFKASLFSIDHNYYYGQHLGASADGRLTGEIISRNTGAASTMDRNGVTAHIQSVAKLNLNEYPNGSVLDIMLHPTAVSEDAGLEVFYQLMQTYFHLGGFAIHGNVMDASILRDAQANPEKYANLQVRVCGWNVYFVNLSREEQNEFIARAEVSSI